ncbi:MAG: DUF3598 family protein [Coleofasciculaceae cyanobacterium]
MNPQLQNWDNFCKYHVGEWHGIKTRYSPDREVIKSWQVVTNLDMSKDGSTINHQDYLTYGDGKTELKSFGTYTKPITSALFLDNSFCWGSKKLESGSIFVFEIGIRLGNQRILGYCRYKENGHLHYISIGPEHLGKGEDNFQRYVNQIDNDWQGILKKMNPDLIVSEPVATSWKPLADLNQNYLTLDFPEGISICCPQKIKTEEAFLIAVDWQISDSLMQRGIGYYDESGFSHFTLEVFTRTA